MLRLTDASVGPRNLSILGKETKIPKLSPGEELSDRSDQGKDEKANVLSVLGISN